MDPIAYHPNRVSHHTTLFTPYDDEELKIYSDRSANPLLGRSAPSQRTNAGPRSGGHKDLQRIPAPAAKPPSARSSPHRPTPAQDQTRTHRAGSLRSPLAASAPPVQLPKRPPHPPPSLPQSQPRDGDEPEAIDRKPPCYSTPSPLVINSSPRSGLSPQQNSGQPNLIQAGEESVGSERLLKRSLPPPDSPDPSINGSQRSISEAVAEHYNLRPNQGKSARGDSPIFGLRKFNNWIKSVIIGKFASRDSSAIKSIPGRQHHKGVKALELGCGKGGDLTKWQKAGVEELYGFDIAKVSVEQAQQRYLESSRQKFLAKFVALDCFSVDISTVLEAKELARPFDAVSLQFCMHYAFENEAKVRMMLNNVSSNLIRGGMFIGTIPDPDLLLSRLDAMNGASNTWGNPLYEVQFPALQPRPVYGFRYNFYLKDAVEHVPEYVVFWQPFVKLAAEYGFELVFKEGFHRIFENERYSNHHRQLLTRMEVTDSGGRCLMSNDQWEAAGFRYGTYFCGKGFILHLHS